VADVLITGARVVDGTGNPWIRGDVSIEGDRVAAVAPPGLIDPAGTREVVDASGHVVCPGFIDIQSHSLVPFLTNGRSLSKVTQGVTTEILGEGWTPAPYGGRISDPLRGYAEAPDEIVTRIKTWARFGQWLDHMTEVGISVNYGSFLGGGTLREYVKGWELGESSPEELETMRRIVREAMADGAFGVATALIYPPSSYTTDAELYETCRVLAETGGVYITHMRSESDALLEALAFTIDLGRKTGCPIEIYHLKAAGRRNWDKLPRAIELIDAARAEGIDVTADMYPYAAGCTGLASSLPPWAAVGGRLLDNLRDPAIRERIRGELLEPSNGWEPLATLSGPEGVLVNELTSARNRGFSHMRLSEIAEARDQHWADCLIDLVLEEERWIFAVYFGQSEEHLPLQLRQPWIKISTDAEGLDPAALSHPAGHPRAYGTYPRVLGKYVREEQVLPLEDAVRKMSAAAADRLGLRDRGVLRAGMLADVVVFDPETIRDNATFERPHQLSTGIRDVWVNGARVLRNGRHTDATPGRPVHGPGR
jgi:N-acyl-D-amino-acid deacylase